MGIEWDCHLFYCSRIYFKKDHDQDISDIYPSFNCSDISLISSERIYFSGKVVRVLWISGPNCEFRFFWPWFRFLYWSFMSFSRCHVVPLCYKIWLKWLRRLLFVRGGITILLVYTSLFYDVSFAMCVSYDSEGTADKPLYCRFALSQYRDWYRHTH